MRWLILGLAGFAVIGVFGGVFASADTVVFSDNFSDGSVDASKWAVGGRRTSWLSGDEGNWTWSHQEITDTNGDHLRMNCAGARFSQQLRCDPLGSGKLQPKRRQHVHPELHMERGCSFACNAVLCPDRRWRQPAVVRRGELG